MGRIRVNLAIKDDDWILYEEKLKRMPTEVKKATDDYMHNDAKELMIKSITGEMPRSNRKKSSERGHAKDSKWWVSFNFDQATTIENKLQGTRKNSFYYLFFPHEGTTKITRPNPWMERAVNKDYRRIVDGLFNMVDRKIEEELKNGK
mgnify:CR=1 FL=1